MNANSNFLKALVLTNFSERYYRMCEQFPLRLEMPQCKAPAPVILRLAAEIGPVKKLSPGRCFEFELPGESSKNKMVLVVQKPTMVEIFYSVVYSGVCVESSFAITAREVLMFGGEPSPQPPYPRPVFQSHEELRSVLAETYSLGSLLTFTPCSSDPSTV